MFALVFDNATQATGVLAFGVACAACLRASASAPAADRQRWTALAAVHALFVVELFAGLRHRLHDLVNGLLQSQGAYMQRGPWQLALLVSALLLAVVLAFAVSRWRWRPGLRMALAATAVLALLFAIESISLHAVDAILYTRIGPLLLIAGLWLISAAVVVVAAFGARR